MPIGFDEGKAFAAANESAESQEATLRAMLWERVAEKASQDETFRKNLTADPKKAVELEAQQMASAAGKNIGAAVVDKVAARARDIYSSIVPELTSDRVENLIFDTIQDVKRAYTLTLLLSQVLFYAGLAMVIAGFVAGLMGGLKVISLFFGSGGIASMLISSLVVSPLDRVQNAAGNLIQLQMAYLAYYKELYLLGGNDHAISREDALAYAKEIDRVTLSLMGSVQTYVDGGRNPDHSRKTKDASDRRKKLANPTDGHEQLPKAS